MHTHKLPQTEPIGTIERKESSIKITENVNGNQVNRFSLC